MKLNFITPSFILCFLILSGCSLPSSNDQNVTYYDDSHISLINNSTDSSIPQSILVFTRKDSGSGIVGTWNRFTEATRTHLGMVLTYHPTEKTDYFYSDGTYKVEYSEQHPVSNGYDCISQTTKGSYTLSVRTNGMYVLTTTDDRTTSSFTYIVSPSFLLLTNE